MADESDGIAPGLLETVKAAIGKEIELEFVKKVKFESKGERTETRVLSLSGHRLYVLLITKTGAKVDFSIHILEIQKLETDKPIKLNIYCGDKQFNFKLLQPKDSIEIIAHITALLKSTLPAGNPDRLLHSSFGPPEEREQREAMVTTLVNNLLNAEVDTEPGPCGGFSRVYASICDYYGQPLLEEVVWDVDTIYLSHNSKEFNLQDFDHLDQKDLVPLISTLEYNDWFTKLNCTSCKLISDVCDAILRVVKKSTSIEELVLDGIGLNRDYCQKLALALTSNPKTAIHTICLSNNSVEDRGMTNLVGTFSKLSHGLVCLAVADSAVTAKGAMHLGQALKSNKYMDSSLKRLDLSKNSLKADGVSALSDFLAKPNAVTHLDLSFTECSLDLLFGALIRGCVHNLTVLNLCGNMFTSRKSKDVAVPPSFQQFFSSSQALKSLDVSDCKLPAEAVRALLTGLSENQVVSGVGINLSKNELRSDGGNAVANCVGSLHNVSQLDISDNGFESDLIKILDKLAANKSIHHLNIGQNVKGRGAGNVMEALVHLISIDDSPIQSLSLADSKLKSELILFLDALGTNESLIELDISGNYMGDEGARILAKGLQLNSKLRTLLWDRNGTTYRGYADIASALDSNHTLHSMPMPLHDAAQSLKPQTEHYLREIEKKLLRNQSPHKVVTEQAYRLQQSLMVTSVQQQSVDRLVVQLQESMNILRHSNEPSVEQEVNTTKQCIHDADKLKQLLLKFHLCTSDTDVEASFSELTANFHQTAEDKMKDNMEKMLVCAAEVCPFVTSKQEVQDHLRSLTKAKSKLNKTFVEEVILSQAAATILNQLSEDKLTVASVMADDIMDMVIQHLESRVLKLDLLLKEHRNKLAAGEKDKLSVGEDDVQAAAKKARNRLSQSAQLMSVADGSEGDRSVGRNNKRRPTYCKRTVATVVEEKTDENKHQVKKPAADFDLDLNVVNLQGTELSHLAKSRARPARGRRPPTRPSNRPTAATDALNEEQLKEDGIDEFWSSTPEKAEVKKDEKAAVEDSKVKKISPKAAPRSAPKPAPKPTPKPKTAERRIQTTPEREDQEGKKTNWKGGLTIGLPGFFKKKNRERSSTGERKSRSEFFSGQEKQTDNPTPQRKPESLKQKSASLESPKEKASSGEKLLLVPKPFAVPRDRSTSGPALRPVPQPRERAVITGTNETTLVQNASETSESKEESKPSARTPPKGPPRFGVGFGGPAGGGLLAEMKLRQEKGGSVKKPVPEKQPTGKDTDSNEGHLKPSSFHRPRLSSGTPPKPATKPSKKEKSEKKEEETKKDQKEEGKEETGEIVKQKEEAKKDQKDEREVETVEVLKEKEKAEVSNEKEKESKEEEGRGETREDEIKDKTIEKEADGTKTRKVEDQKMEESQKPVEKDETNATEEKPEEVEVIKEEKQEEKPEEKREQKQEQKREEKRAEKREEKREVKKEQKREEKPTNEIVPEEDTKSDPKEVKGISTENKNGIASKALNPAKISSADDLWVKRPGENKTPISPAIPRSKSLSHRPGSRSADKPVIKGRSATLPKPYSPGRAPGAASSRKLSWEMPSAGETREKSKKEVKETIKEEEGSSNKTTDPKNTVEENTPTVRPDDGLTAMDKLMDVTNETPL